MNLKKLFNKYNISLSDKQEKMFEKYFNFLIKTNEKLNLTAITEEKDAEIKHFLDSVLPYSEFSKNATVIDIGSGAGFPGIPLKIIRPDLKIVLVDSLNKRVNFLNETINLLEMKDIIAVHSRAEDFARLNREKFDYAVARAVAPLNTLVEYLLPLIKLDGCAVIYKSAKLDEEIVEAEKAIKILGGKIEKVLEYDCSEENMERKILFLKKVKPTPNKYPRDKNKPKTNPIK